MTPAIPDWIRSAEVPGYVNAYTLVPNETRLYGTESLYGDWNGRVLLLAKDFACSDLVRRRIDNNDSRPYRHEPGLMTNKRLQRYAAPVTRSNDHFTCGLLYGSALANLLRDDGKMSGALPARSNALAYGARVLAFTVEHMPNLEAIVCLGQEAWDCCDIAFGLPCDWKTARGDVQVFEARSLRFVAAFHPAARISSEQAARPWELVYAALSDANQPTPVRNCA